MAESYINYIKLPDGNVAKFSLPNTLKIGNQTYDGTSNVSATTATQSANGLMSAADKKKLDGIAEGANKTIVDATLSNSSANPVQNKVIKTELDKKADNTALDAKADKTALDGKLDKTGGTLTGNLTGKYITGTWLQTTEATDLGRTPGKVAVLDQSGWVYYRTPAEIKSDIGADAVATTSANGLMSASDKSKLDGIAAGANKTTVDTALSNSSTNPVQNKVIQSALDGKAGTAVATQSVNGLMSASDKSKLDGIAAGATKITVDTALSDTSTNPVQNKIVNDALKGKFSTSGGGISGDVTMFKRLDVKGVLDAHETIMAEKDVQCLYDNDVRIRIACDSSGAAKITTTDGISYARLKIASPTDNNDATTKNYVDSKWDDMRQIVNTEIQSVIAGLLDKTYPVGSIYISAKSTNPKDLFGGTWQQIAGKFLVGVGNGFVVGDSGGSKTHTHTTGDHTLTTDEMPYHAHNIWYPNSAGPTTSEIGYPLTGAKNTWCANASHTDGQGGDAAHNHGDTGSASNLPPYIAVWMWKRTA